MHSLTFTKSSFLTLLFTSFATGLHAQSFLQPTEDMPMKQNEQMTLESNATCPVHVKGTYDVILKGSFTYWQPIQENMQLGVVSDNTEDPLDLVDGKEVDLDFDYKPGFKIGLGFNFNYDNWDTFLEYTWFRGTEKVHKNLDSDDVLFPAWQIPDFLNPQYKSGSEKWKLHMDFLDWDLARSNTVGQKLCIRSFFGLRWAWIRQNVDVEYVNTIPSDAIIWPSTTIHQSSHSWGVGPRIGFCSNWKLGKGFRLFGNGEFDILFTQYDLKFKQTSNVSVANRYIIRKDDANYLRAHADLALGLGWGNYFAGNKYYFDLSADYGFQVFFNQNMFRNIINANAVGANILPNGNLYVQGLTISARFDF